MLKSAILLALIFGLCSCHSEEPNTEEQEAAPEKFTKSTEDLVKDSKPKLSANERMERLEQVISAFSNPPAPSEVLLSREDIDLLLCSLDSDTPAENRLYRNIIINAISSDGTDIDDLLISRVRNGMPEPIYRKNLLEMIHSRSQKTKK